MYRKFGNSKENSRAFGTDYSNKGREQEPLGGSAISEPSQEIMTQMETFQLIKGIKEDLTTIKRTQEIQGRQQEHILSLLEKMQM